jgi:hypothetical protein
VGQLMADGEALTRSLPGSNEGNYEQIEEE